MVLDLLCVAQGHRVVPSADSPGSHPDLIFTLTPHDTWHLLLTRHFMDDHGRVTAEDVTHLAEAMIDSGVTTATLATNTTLTRQAIGAVLTAYQPRGLFIEWWDSDRLVAYIQQHSDLAFKWFQDTATTTGIRAVTFDLTFINQPKREFNPLFRPFARLEGLADFLTETARVPVESAPNDHVRLLYDDYTVHIGQDLVERDAIAKLRDFARAHAYAYEGFIHRIAAVRCRVEGRLRLTDLDAPIIELVSLLAGYLYAQRTIPRGWLVAVRSTLRVPTFLTDIRLPTHVEVDRERSYVILRDGRVVEEEVMAFDLPENFAPPYYPGTLTVPGAPRYDPSHQVLCEVRVAQPLTERSERLIALELAQEIEVIRRSKHFLVSPADLWEFRSLLGRLADLMEVRPYDGALIVSIYHPRKFLPPRYQVDESPEFAGWDEEQAEALDAAIRAAYAAARSQGLSVRQLSTREVNRIIIPQVQASHPRYEVEMVGPGDNLTTPVDLLERELTYSTVVWLEGELGDWAWLETQVFAPLQEEVTPDAAQPALLEEAPAQRPRGRFRLTFDLDEFQDSVILIPRLTWQPRVSRPTAELANQGRDYFVQLLQQILDELSRRDLPYRVDVPSYYFQAFGMDYGVERAPAASSEEE